MDEKDLPALPERLRAEIERTVYLDILHHDAANEIDRLRAEVDALRVDAERYRFIRMNRLWLKANLPMIAAPEFDAAIDAARAEKGPADA